MEPLEQQGGRPRSARRGKPGEPAWAGLGAGHPPELPGLAAGLGAGHPPRAARPGARPGPARGPATHQRPPACSPA